MKHFNLFISVVLIFLFITSEVDPQAYEKFHLMENNGLSKTEIYKANDSSTEVEQDWVAIYNGPASLSDEATDIAVDSFSNVYVTGHSQGLGYDYDCATIKYDARGVVEWINRYDGGYDDYAYKLALDDSGNVYITGSSFDSGSNEDYLIIKYNTNGIEQWIRKYNGPGNSFDRSNDIAVDDEGNVYVTGESSGLGSEKDYATIKYNSFGIEEWIRRYDGPANSYDEAVGIAIDNLGNIVVTGRSIGLNSRFNYATIKYNPEGVETWVQRFSFFGNYSDIPYDIAVDNFGNIIVTGTGASLDSTSFAPDYLTIKYNSSGVQLWTERYDGPGNDFDEAKIVAVDDSGNIHITGWSAGDSGSHDYATIKYNSSGIEQWVSRFNGGFVHDLAIDKLGNVYVTGNYFDSTTIGDYMTIKYDSYGVQQWLVGYNGPGNGLDGAVAITLDRFDNIYITGLVEVQGGIPTFDYATVKYKQSIVPVELTSFTASVSNNDVILNWQTATETNNLGFEIQRRVGSKQATVGNWEVIGFVPGFGTTTEPKSYKFEDVDVFYGVYFYCLKQIDFDGSFEYSKIIEASVGMHTEFSLEQNYPNPFNPITTINYTIAEPSHVVLKVYNTLGENVSVLVNEEKEMGRYSLTFNAQDLSSGVYFFQLNAAGVSGEFNFIKKFVLLK